MQEFLDTLKQVARSGDFCYFSDQKAFFPEIEIKSLGEAIALPLPASQAKALIELAHQAPYGKGSETLIDTKVRKCWELHADELVFHNKAWDKMLNKFLRESEVYLDLEDKSLEAELYKMLIYEEGGFFAPHQDSEKIDDMVATLVICLPSKHEGGELIISHAGDEFTFDSAQAEGLQQFQSALFYADCRHELRPLISGHRLCLTYNVRLKKSSKQKPLAVGGEQQIHDLAKYLKSWQKQKDRQPKLVVALNHQYSEQNFSYTKLKGLDRSQCEVLLKAGDEAGLKTYITLLERYECYDAYETGGYSRGRWYDDEDDDEELEQGDLIEDSLMLMSLQDQHGKDIMTNMPLNSSEIINLEQWDKLKAIEEDHEGYTGNAGCTMSYWYRFAAVVFWSADDEFKLTLESDLDAAVRQVCKLSQKKSPDSNQPGLLKNQLLLLVQYIESKRSDSRWSRARLNKEAAGQLFDCLADYGDLDLLKSYLFPHSLDLEVEWTASRLVTLEKLYSRPFILELMQNIEKYVEYHSFERLLSLSKNLTSSVLREESTIVPSLLKAFTRLAHSHHEHAPDLLKIIKRSLDLKSLQVIFKFMQAKPRHFNIESTLHNILKKVVRDFKNAEPVLRDQLIDFLEKNKSTLIKKAGNEPEADYKPRIPEIPANAAAATKQLLAFMRDPTQESKDFRILKKLRLELENDIKRYDVDVETHFDPRPRPQSLLCLKKGAKQRELIKVHKKRLNLAKEYQKLIDCL